MTRSRINKPTSSTKKFRPSLTPEACEMQMVSDVVDMTRRQIAEGTLSPTVQIHYLKLASSKEKLEVEKLRGENELLRAKIKSLESSQRSEEMYERALKAMRSYSGQIEEEEYDDDEYYD